MCYCDFNTGSSQGPSCIRCQSRTQIAICRASFCKLMYFKAKCFHFIGCISTFWFKTYCRFKLKRKRLIDTAKLCYFHNVIIPLNIINNSVEVFSPSCYEYILRLPIKYSSCLMDSCFR